MMKKYFVFFSFLIHFAHQNIQAQSILRDRYAYETASEMYKVSDTLAFTKDAAIIIEKIDKELKKGTLIEDDKIWNNLQLLEPYRMSEQVQTAVENWVQAVDKYSPKSNQIFWIEVKDIIKAYHTHDFDKVIAQSRQLLLRSSGYYDEVDYAVRNNMALALMHQNKDLCAQIELEIIKKTGKKERHLYIPAFINLTVLYERLGKSQEAEAISKEVLVYTKSENITIPLVNFNATWYMFLNNQSYPMIENLRILERSDVEKYDNFIQNVKNEYKSRPMSEVGWLGKLGFSQIGGNVATGMSIYFIFNAVLLVLFWIILGFLRGLPKFFIWVTALIMSAFLLFLGFMIQEEGDAGIFPFFATFFLIIRCITLRRK